MTDMRVQFSIDVEVWKAFRIKALQEDITVGNALRNLVANDLSKAERKEKANPPVKAIKKESE